MNLLTYFAGLGLMIFTLGCGENRRAVEPESAADTSVSHQPMAHGDSLGHQGHTMDSDQGEDRADHAEGHTADHAVHAAPGHDRAHPQEHAAAHAGQDHAAAGHAADAAQDHAAVDHDAMDHEAMDHEAMDHDAAMDHEAMDHEPAMDHEAMDHDALTPDAMEDHAGHEAEDHATTEQHPETGHAQEHEGMEEDAGAHEMMEMSSTLLPSLPMSRDGSGTSWMPDSSPIHAVHGTAGDWSLMVHGVLFLRYTNQDVFESGTRGGDSFDAPNWVMGMASRNLTAGSQISFRGMMSLDPFTEGGDGYPLLFQTGETFEGTPLIDRQHPHDLFMEMAAIYGHDLSRNVGYHVYVGYPGEPALGPPAFPHRPSARHNPDAPLGHHWQDATHIAFGTATLGLRMGPARVEGSIFTGREPDEERLNFDRPRFDSYSGRLSANPAESVSLQLSRGFLKSPEVLKADEDVWRTTASVMHNSRIGRRGNWATTFLWGMNESSGGHHDGDDHGEETTTSHTLLAETDLQMGPQAYYARVDWGQKPAHDLGLGEEFGDERLFEITAATLGTARDLVNFGSLKLTLGGQGILYSVPAPLRPIYGSNPVSLEIFLKLSPGLLRHRMAQETHHSN